MTVTRYRLHVGEVVQHDELMEWYLVTNVDRPRHPVGVCIISDNPKRVGNHFGLTGIRPVDQDADVPDQVWAAVATWRLTQ